MSTKKKTQKWNDFKNANIVSRFDDGKLLVNEIINKKKLKFQENWWSLKLKTYL